MALGYTCSIVSKILLKLYMEDDEFRCTLDSCTVRRHLPYGATTTVCCDYHVASVFGLCLLHLFALVAPTLERKQSFHQGVAVTACPTAAVETNESQTTFDTAYRA
jgi:hypothetical protein